MPKLTLAGVMRALEMAGAATPAFTALFDQVKGTFGAADRATLESAYAAARRKSDAAHQGLQDAAGGR